MCYPTAKFWPRRTHTHCAVCKAAHLLFVQDRSIILQLQKLLGRGIAAP